MSKYTSESDSSSSRYSRHRGRSSSSSSGSSRHRHRKSKKSRCSSKEKYKKSSRSHRSHHTRSRSHSRSKYSRSSSRDRLKYRSRSKDKHHRKSRHHRSRSHSRSHSSKYHSRSSSKETYTRRSKSPVKRSQSPESRSKGVSKKIVPENPTEQLREKLLKAIKAAESADYQLKAQGVLPKGVKSRNDINNLTTQNISKAQSETIKDINSDIFVQKSFISSKSKKSLKSEEDDDVVIVTEVSPSYDVPSTLPVVDPKSIFHASFFVDPQIKLDKWVKKLYQIRQKAVSGEPMDY